MNIDAMLAGYIECALWSTHNDLFETSECDFCHERVKHLAKGWGSPYTEEITECPESADKQHEVSEPEEHSECLDGDYDADDIEQDTLDAMRRDCASFLRAAEEEFGAELDRADIEAAQFGHDFWLTRHHHGTGFWDRGLGRLGDGLTKLAHPYGDFNLWANPETGKVAGD